MVKDSKDSGCELYILQRVTPIRSHSLQAVLALLGLGVVLASCSEHESGTRPAVRQVTPDALGATPSMDVATSARPPFDFYLLALTVHAAFCADGHADQKDCRLGSKRPLVIHGLWPERLEPGTWPRDCPAPRLRLESSTLQVLQDYMPGVHSGLHVHEWREHGGCSGLDADVYFEQAIMLAHEMDAALAANLTTLAGGEATAAQIRAAADSVHPGSGATFTLHCRTLRGAPPELRNRPFLIEIRQCVDNDGAMGEPATLLDCASVNRHDQGCGAVFRIAKTPR